MQKLRAEFYTGPRRPAVHTAREVLGVRPRRNHLKAWVGLASGRCLRLGWDVGQSQAMSYEEQTYMYLVRFLVYISLPHGYTTSQIFSYPYRSPAPP